LKLAASLGVMTPPSRAKHAKQRDLAVNERTTHLGNQLGRRVRLNVVSPQQTATKDASSAPPVRVQRCIGETESGIEVREEELGAITAQRVYKMRCECGRSWFELDLPKVVKCPACRKLGLVSA
jgi:hypothetical protein